MREQLFLRQRTSGYAYAFFQLGYAERRSDSSDHISQKHHGEPRSPAVVFDGKLSYAALGPNKECSQSISEETLL
ncbi:hypothetical protein N7508_007190 [Penicillium antarcticum]|nr:uncharacterized protein N7508_007190 [Penicillium antarcticum]KAJ5302327.1 hypothetical protein N7508_007190 [Penicillium antarcticum]